MSLAPRTLPGRIGLAFVVLIVATWLAAGGALFVVLRGLHESETNARLTDIAVPLVARLRTSVAAGQGTQAILADLDQQIAGTGVGVYLQLFDARIVGLGGAAESLAGLSVDPALARGDLEQGVYRAADGSRWAWSASILRNANVRGPRALIVATADTAAGDALRDLLAALPAVIAVTLLVGIPAALWLSRSITGPIRRLALAADALAAAPDSPDEASVAPLRLDGPAEVQELTARFDGMRRELREGRRRESELLADLRHDLRTPLTVIEGFAEALVDGTARGADSERAARAIAEEARRIDALVDALGDLERLRHGGSLRPERLSAASMVEEAAARFAGSADPARVVVEADPGPPGLELIADRTAVQRMLANLVSNALVAVAADASGPSPHHVLVSASAASDTRTGVPAVVLGVSDDGPGFPPGAAERAFDRFYRADRARSGPGSGLGLAIVRELAVAHGGRAYAENLAPRGARVSVVLPVALAPAPRPAAPERARPDAASRPAAG